MGQPALQPQSNQPAFNENRLVSIGVAVYNEEQHLRNTLDSLLAQDYENFEILISDNDSTDGTSSICHEYLSKDERVRYYRNETNIGSLANFNKVFERANGELFMWASGHDLYHQSFITRCATLMNQDSSIVLCYALTLWIDVHGQPLELVPDSVDTRGVVSQYSRLNMVIWNLSTAFPICGMHRTRALQQTSLLQKLAAPDVALIAELSLMGTFAHIPEPLYYARKLTDWGSWRRYVEKHFQHKGGGWSAQLLFWRMFAEMIRAVTRHIDSFFGRVGGITSVILCLIFKYYWILFGLLSLSIRRSHRQK